MKRRPKWSTVTMALAVIAALAIASPVLGLSSSIKRAIKKEVSKQVASATGPVGATGPQGIPGPATPPDAFTSAGLLNSDASCFTSTGNQWDNIVPPGVNNVVSYQRDPFGTVHLRGVALKCGAPPSGDTIFTLPSGYRPAAQEVQVALYSTGANRVNIDTSGGVVAAGGPASGASVSLDGLTFRCAPSGSNGCP
jgi:hypothetical protein